MKGYHGLAPAPGGATLGVFSEAQIYFPPLAWQLAFRDDCRLLDGQGWADVSDWLEMAPDQIRDLSELVPALPVVTHPRHRPEALDDWMEVFDEASTFIVQSDEARPKN